MEMTLNVVDANGFKDAIKNNSFTSGNVATNGSFATSNNAWCRFDGTVTSYGYNPTYDEIGHTKNGVSRLWLYNFEPYKDQNLPLEFLRRGRAQDLQPMITAWSALINQDGTLKDKYKNYPFPSWQPKELERLVITNEDIEKGYKLIDWTTYLLPCVSTKTEYMDSHDEYQIKVITHLLNFYGSFQHGYYWSPLRLTAKIKTTTGNIYSKNEIGISPDFSYEDLSKDTILDKSNNCLQHLYIRIY